MSDKIKKFDGGGVIWEAPIAYASSSGGGTTLSPLDLNTIQQSYASTFPMDLDYMDMLEKAADEEEFRMLGVKDAPTLEEAEEELAAAAKRLADFQATMKGSAYGLGTTEEGDQADQYFTRQAELQAELEQARNTYVALGGDPDPSLLSKLGQGALDLIGGAGQAFSDIITLGTGPKVAQTLLDPVSILLGGLGGTINYAESGKTTPVILGQTSSGMPVGLNIPDPRTILEGGLTTFIPGAAAVATTAGALSLGDEKDQDPTSGVGPTAAGVLTAAAADDDAAGAIKTTDQVTVDDAGADAAANIQVGALDSKKTADADADIQVSALDAKKKADADIQVSALDAKKKADADIQVSALDAKKKADADGTPAFKLDQLGGPVDIKVADGTPAYEVDQLGGPTDIKVGTINPYEYEPSSIRVGAVTPEPIKSTITGGGSTGTLTLPPSLRGIREEPGDLVDIKYLYDFAKGLDQPFLTTEEQEMLKDLNVYAEGGEVANEDAVDMLTKPRRPGEYGRSYFTPGQFVPTGTALGGAALNANAIQIPQYTYQRELLPQFGGPAAGVTTPATTIPTTTTPVGTTPTLSDTLGQEGIANLLSNITGMFGGSAGTTPAGTTPAGTTPAGTTPAGTTPAGTTPAGTTPDGTTPAGTTPTPNAYNTFINQFRGRNLTPEDYTTIANSGYTIEQVASSFGVDPNQLRSNINYYTNGSMTTADGKVGGIGMGNLLVSLGGTRNADGTITDNFSTIFGFVDGAWRPVGETTTATADTADTTATTTTTTGAADTATTGAADAVDTLLSSTEQWMVANRGYIDNGDGTITDSTTGYVYDADTGKGYFPSSTDTTTTAADTTADTTTTAADTTADTTTTAADTTTTTADTAQTATDFLLDLGYGQEMTGQEAANKLASDLNTMAESEFGVDTLLDMLGIDTAEEKANVAKLTPNPFMKLDIAGGESNVLPEGVGGMDVLSPAEAALQQDLISKQATSLAQSGGNPFQQAIYSSLSSDTAGLQDSLPYYAGVVGDVLRSGGDTLTGTAEKFNLTVPEAAEELMLTGAMTPDEVAGLVDISGLTKNGQPATTGDPALDTMIALIEGGTTTLEEAAYIYNIPADQAEEVYKDVINNRLQPIQAAAQGGMMQGQGYYLGGPTDGMADLVPATIDGNQPAALSDGEFVIPADVVSHLGNGNSEAGAQQLYSMMDRVRTERTGTTKQGPEINPTKMMPA